MQTGARHSAVLIYLTPRQSCTPYLVLCNPCLTPQALWCGCIQNEFHSRSNATSMHYFSSGVSISQRHLFFFMLLHNVGSAFLNKLSECSKAFFIFFFGEHAVLSPQLYHAYE